jgi:hypothetical protein
MRALLSLLAAALLLATGCSDNPVGNVCYLGRDAGTTTTNPTTTVSSPALECQSHLCLQVPLGDGVVLPDEHRENNPLCTAECESDDDCDRVPESPCVNGFTCAVPVTVGRYCCKKLCVCRDYLIIPDGGVPIPAACDPTNPGNTCINLPGR